ncbi:MAG: NAD(P)/FAD-dependent oxidoreductase [Flavisolibacter sp.]|nr:NAD(P)/FAD-dependent oxidoreductase [Flavisolibacter sp.]
MISIRPVYKYDCDVLIIGGGPAGSSLAYYLAKEGISVIIVEAYKFPRDKTCGDAVSRVALTELQALGITDLKEFSEANIVNDVALFVEDEKVSVGLAKPENHLLQGRVIPRLQLDNWIYKAAKKMGAAYLEDARLSSYTVHKEYVLAEIKERNGANHIRAKMIVGADGSNSTVARILHGIKPDEAYQLLGLRAYFEGVNGPDDRCDIFFSKENFPGLFWFFPTGKGTANVGSAMIASTLPQNETHVKELLLQQIQKNKNLAQRIGDGKIRGKISGWPLTFQSPTHQVVNERLALIGDAAGLINPLSGDGIQYALLSGRWASETIIECCRKNNFSIAALTAYKKKLHKEMAYDMAVSNLLIKVTRNRTFTPLWMEVLLIVFERAKSDAEYASIIAGIFDGTLPSYKALNPSFILKSILQGGVHIGVNTTSGILQGPKHWEQKTKDTGLLLKNIIQNIKQNPREQVKWLTGIARTGLEVSGHILKEMKTRER